MSKKSSAKKTKKIVMVSGGFDPVHIGHVRLFNEAKKLGDELVILLNNDNWLKLKKGYAFMPEHERKEIIESFEAVDRVVLSHHSKNTKDISVCEDIKLIRPHIFAKGGDRTYDNIPEVSICEELKCEMIFNLGRGGKVQSSSALVKKAKLKKNATR
ncbi:adenylyltransferase/cytidyltransferase family protein [Patescibacteria group bacterium]|nr:adenylyltransferase/cytidyltransferase family protein [Patescibacteria group bacterium]